MVPPQVVLQCIKILWEGSLGCKKLLKFTCLIMKFHNCHHSSIHKLVYSGVQLVVRFPSVTVKTKVLLHCVWSVSHLAGGRAGGEAIFSAFANVSHWVILCIKSIISHHLSVSLPQFKEFSIVYNMALSLQLAAAVAIFFPLQVSRQFFCTCTFKQHLQPASSYGQGIPTNIYTLNSFILHLL